MGINNGGIFSLGDVSVLQQQGNWSEGNWVQDENRVLRNRYGYFGGGTNSSNILIGTIDRIDFSTTTTEVVTKGSMLVKAEELAATGNVDYGYMGGGRNVAGGEYYSAIWRLDYSNDNQDTLRRSKLPIIKYGFAAVGNNDYGYFGGGRTHPGSTAGSQIYRLDYSNDETDASPKSILSALSGHLYAAATGNANYGYWGGGEIPSLSIDDISRLDYANDSVDATPKGTAGADRYDLAATSNSNYGYFGGGYDGPGGPNKHDSRVFRLDYSNDTVNAISKGDLSAKRSKLSATGNRDYGYFGGGYNGIPNPEVYYTLVDRIDYANDTSTAEVKGNLVINRNSGIALSSAENVLPKQYDSVPDISDTNIQSVGTDYGYFAGGRIVGVDVYSNIYRIDYSSDTDAPQKSYLSQKKTTLAAIGNISYGYFAGGWIPGSPNVYQSIIERIDYSNDSVNTSLKSVMSASRYNLAAIGNENYGYFAGGSPGAISTIDRLDYSNDTVNASPKSTLVAAAGIAAVGTLDYGYFAGGWAPASVEYSTISRMDYSNDAVSPVAKSDLSGDRHGVAASGNSSYGYFGGGYTGTGYVAIIDKFDYSSDTTDAVDKAPTAFSSARQYRVATGNSSYGYFAGGYNGTDEISNIDRINYSNDTVAASGTLGHKRYGAAAVSSRDNALPTTRIAERVGLLLDPYTFGKVKYTVSNYGYFGGGIEIPAGSSASTIDRLDFSSDTVGGRFSTTLTQPKDWLSATGNSHYGYFGSSTTYSTVDRLDYSNETVLDVSGLEGSFAGDHTAATGNQNYGYFAGGYTSAYLSDIKRLDYSNETMIPRGFLSLMGPAPTTGRRSLAATGNENYGYFGGGQSDNLNDTSLVSRIDYSNDNQIALTRGPLLDDRHSAATSGNENYGYFGAGYNTAVPGAISTINRIDYNNDTVIAVAKGPVLGSRYALGGTTGSDCGYWAGGNPATTPVVSWIARNQFSNDTAQGLHKGNLSSRRYTLAAVSARINGFGLLSDYPEGRLGTSNYGYFGGGGYHNLPILSTIDRIDYSNDTTRSIEKGTLTHARWGLSAVGNSYYGYFGGGTNAANYPAATSYVDRIDYSNDGVQASPKGPLGAARRNWAAIGNNNVGYFSGGYSSPGDNPNTFDDTYKIVYANDTVTYSSAAVDHLVLVNARQGVATAGNQTYAYYAGGYMNGGSGTDYLSRIQRFEYSADDTVTSLRGTLQSYPGGATLLAGTGNKDYGYFAGGSPSSGQVSFIDRLDYSNDTANAIYKTNISANKSSIGATGNPNSGYWGGGGSPATPAGYSAVDRLDYSNDTSIVSKGPLTVSRSYLSATSARESDLPIIGLTSEQFINPGNNTQQGGAAYGWFAGGSTNPSTTISTLDRLDYSNDTANAVAKGSLSANKEGLGSIGNLNYGYFGGGDAPGGMSNTIDRIDYSNNNVSTISATLTVARWVLSAVGNKDYGYFAGGRVPGSPDVFHSTVDRIDYSNDTVRSPFQGPLNDLQTGQNASAGNSSYGYVAGGYDGSSPPEALVNRIDYSNDTATAVPKGSLTTARDRLAATGNENYGYFGGGYGTASTFSMIERIEYANDLAVAAPKGTLTNNGKYGLSATGNKDYGYWAGGQNSSNAYTNTIERTDYSNETTVLTQRLLSTAVKNLSGSSAGANGLPQ